MQKWVYGWYEMKWSYPGDLISEVNIICDWKCPLRRCYGSKKNNKKSFLLENTAM